MMSKRTLNTCKYPCGVCRKNANFGAIFCNGHCKKWYHFKCVNLSYNEVKNVQLAEYKLWQCPICSNITSNDIPEKDVGLSTIETIEEFSEQSNCSSLAEEINKSIINENDELREELFKSKNQNSLYVFELEDKINDMQEKLESQKKIFTETEDKLTQQIKHLEKKCNTKRKLN